MTRVKIADTAAPFPTVWLRHDRPEPPDALLWCYGGMTPHCLEAIARLRDVEGLHVDLAVVSQLSPVPAGHIHKVSSECGARVFAYAEEASAEFGWSAEIEAQVHAIAEAGATHVRIGGAHHPIPSSRSLEAAALPQAADVVARIVECF